MQNIQIITDSGCDLDRNTIKELGIKVLPFNVTISDLSFRETIDKTTEEVYELMEQYDDIPKTAQINTIEFEEAYTEAYENGVTDIICVTINKKGSATHDNSILAKNNFFEEHPEAVDKVSIYNLDSKCYTCSYGYPIQEAVKKIRRGACAEDVVAFLSDWFDTLAIYAVAGTLKYARMSGRISAVKAFAGEVLGLKPVIEFADGEATPVDKFRGIKNTVPKLMEWAENKMTPQSPYVIIHGKDDTAAKELGAAMEKKFGRKAEGYYRIGAVVSANIGSDVTAILIRRRKI